MYCTCSIRRFLETGGCMLGTVIATNEFNSLLALSTFIFPYFYWRKQGEKEGGKSPRSLT